MEISNRNISIMELMDYQEQLTNSTRSTIERFMFHDVSIDWEKNDLWVEMYNLLKATMILIDGWWIERDILD